LCEARVKNQYGGYAAPRRVALNTAELDGLRDQKFESGSSREESSANFLEPTFDRKEFTADVTRFCRD